MTKNRDIKIFYVAVPAFNCCILLQGLGARIRSRVFCCRCCGRVVRNIRCEGLGGM